MTVLKLKLLNFKSGLNQKAYIKIENSLGESSLKIEIYLNRTQQSSVKI